MRVGEGGNILFAHRPGFFSKVRMIDSIDSIYTLPPVELQELAEEIETLRTELPKPVSKVATACLKALHGFRTREDIPARHTLVVGRADQLEDDLGLMEVALSREDGLALEHFAKDAASAPHVDGRRVSSKLKKQLRRAIPPSYHQRSVISSSFAIAPAALRHRLVVVPSQSKVCNL